MSEPIICPSCNKIAGFQSITREKAKEIRIAIRNMKLPEVEEMGGIEKLELITFGFCPWCGDPIKLEE